MREFLKCHPALLHPWTGGWIALFVVVALVPVGYCQHNISWAALAGAIVAVLGVLTIGRPILRLGYKEWLKQSRTIDGGSLTPTIEEQREDLESQLDGKAVQCTGPLLVIVGTLLNGASGFFPIGGAP